MEGATTAAIDFSAFLGSLTSAVTVGDILTILGLAAGAGMVFVVMWFGVRKLTGIFINALKKGKLKV